MFNPVIGLSKVGNGRDMQTSGRAQIELQLSSSFYVTIFTLNLNRDNSIITLYLVINVPPLLGPCQRPARFVMNYSKKYNMHLCEHISNSAHLLYMAPLAVFLKRPRSKVRA